MAEGEGRQFVAFTGVCMHELEQAVDDARLSAETAARTILDAIAAQLAVTVPARVKAWVTTQLEVTKQRSAAQLTDLKARATAAAPRIRAELAVDTLWRHRVGFVELPTNHYRNDYRLVDGAPRMLDAPAQVALSTIARELEARFGYARDDAFVRPSWPALASALETYAGAYETFVRARRALENAQRTLERAQATTRWDQA
jgi:hypothetical protein